MASVLKKRVRELEISSKRRRDIDPEDDPFARDPDSSNSNSDSEDNIAAGREHYEAVGKSKLRKPERVQLDSKKYGGTIISRAALNGDEDEDLLAPESDEDDDPFAAPSDNQNDDEDEDLEIDGDNNAGEDDEIDSDEAFEDGDEEKFRGKGFVFRGSGASHKMVTDSIADDGSDDIDSSDASAQISGSDSASGSDIDLEDMEGIQISTEDEDDDDDNSDNDEDEDELEMSARSEVATAPRRPETKREQMKSIMSDSARLASQLSKAASADAEKGASVRRQYQTYDRLVDTRMKLQKGLTTTNNLSTLDAISEPEAQEAVRKAEEAALALFSTIESIRRTIHETLQNSADSGKSSPKRKRPAAVSPAMAEIDILDRISDLDTELDSRRRTVLDKWANKTRSTTQPIPSSSSSKLKSSSDGANSQPDLSSVIDTYLHSSMDKLVTESKTDLTTDASITTSAKIPSLPPFQDTIFYQSLLRDIINTRAHLNSSNSTSQQQTSSSLNNTNTNTILPIKLHPSGIQSALLHNKQINRKASKGRKIRYTVHEKLENFMTGTGRGATGGQWTDAAVREFFGSLLGAGNVLVEDEDAMDSLDEDIGMGEDGDQREVEALRLFRS